MKIIFFGTPETAVPFLELCAETAEVPLVVTQPDKPAGRKLVLTPPPVKAAAARRGLTVLQPVKPAQVLEQLRSVQADLGVVVAYGRIFPESVIASTRLGLLNVHFSLLPKYRGAAPIQWSLWKGEVRTGVSLFWIDKGMDTGPLFLQQEVPVEPADDASTLEGTLVRVGAEALREALASVARGEVRRVPQTGEPSLAPMLDKSHGALRFDRPAWEVHNQVRALCRWPVAYRELRGKGGNALRLSILKTLPPEQSPEPSTQNPAPGSIASIEKDRGILVQCSPGRIWLHRVQPEGRKPMEASDFANGFRLQAGDIL